MLRDFLFLTGVTMETQRAQGEKVQDEQVTANAYSHN